MLILSSVRSGVGFVLGWISSRLIWLGFVSLSFCFSWVGVVSEL